MAKSSLLVRALAEALGTFILVTAVVDSICGGNGVDPLAAAAALMIGVYCVGDVSGGHLNPAVSFGVWLCSFLKHTDFTIVELVVYILAQLTGALIAGFKNAYIWHTAAGGFTSNMAGSTGPTAIMAGNKAHPLENQILGTTMTNVSAAPGGLLSVGVAELVYTAILVFVVLNVATCGDEGKGMKNSYFGLAIGFVLAASVSAIGSISMSCINPAVAFAIAMLDMCFGNLPTADYQRSWPFLMFLFYSLMELLGAIFAVLFFFICRRHQVGKGDKAGKPDMVARFVSEFLGTFVLCLTVMLVCHAPPSHNAALGIASSLMVMIYALGGVSGANFNPAVSLGIAVVKMMTDTKNIAAAAIDFGVYLVAQLLGSVVALLGSVLILREIKTTLVGKEIADATVLPAAKGAWMAVITAEMMFTFILVFTVLNSAVRQAPNQFYGLTIGFVIVAGAFSLGSISGGCFNPAVALMLDFGGAVNKAQKFRIGFGFVYGILELLAGAIAALFYVCVSAGKQDAGDKLDQVYDDLEDKDEEDDYEEEE